MQVCKLQAVQPPAQLATRGLAAGTLHYCECFHWLSSERECLQSRWKWLQWRVSKVPPPSLFCRKQEAKKKIIDLGIFSQDIWISIYGWNVSTMATLGREESGRCREVLNKRQCMDFFPLGWKKVAVSGGLTLARSRRSKPWEVKLNKNEKSNGSPFFVQEKGTC